MKKPYDEAEELKLRLMGLGDFSVRKSYYPELKENIAELQREKDRYQHIFSSALHGIFQTDLDGRLIVANPALAKICGYASERAMIESIKNVFSELFFDGSEVKALLQRLAEQPEVTDFECRFKSFTGGEVSVSLSARHDPANFLEFFVVDDTQRKAAQAALLQAKNIAEAANRAKDNFLAMMSHELRTPLNGILGVASLMGFEPLTDTQRDYMDIIDHSGRALLAIIEDILDISRIEQGTLSIKEENFELIPFLEELKRLFLASANVKHLSFDVVLKDPLPKIVHTDQHRLHQVLSNLVGNGIKYTERGSVKLIVSVSERRLQFVVQDSGIGIPKEFLEKIFAPFTQVDDSYTRKVGGAGLGLAIVSKLGNLIGGKIEVSSQFGRGSTFTFSLPLQESLSSESNKEPEFNLQKTSPLKILLVEDDFTNQLVITNMLKVLSSPAELANNGQEALDRMEQESFDLVLMDCLMPVLDGLEATRKIRERESNKSLNTRTPIVALTALVMDEDRERCAAAGMDDFLAKPINMADLKRVLDYYGNLQH